MLSLIAFAKSFEMTPADALAEEPDSVMVMPRVLKFNVWEPVDAVVMEFTRTVWDTVAPRRSP